MAFVDWDDNQWVPKGAPKPVDPVYQAAAAKPQQVWDSTYNTWREGTRLWDEASGAWWDENTGNVWNNAVGIDQSVNEYNDYQKVLQEFYGGPDGGGFANNPLVSQPSLFKPQPATQKIGWADWYNADTAMDNAPRNDPIRAAFTEFDLATSKNVPWPKSNSFENLYNSIPEEERPYELVNGRKSYGLPAAGGTGGNLPFSQIFGKVNTGLDALAETTRDLSEPMMRQLPVTSTAFGVSDLMGWTKPYDYKTLGGTAQNLADPKSFFTEQQNDLQQRNALDQLVTQIAFDPTNAIGAGAVSKALKGVEAAGTLGKLARGAGAVNQAIDVGTAKAVGGLLAPLGRAARPLASEAGSIPAGVAARIATGAGGAVVGGLTTPDDADPFERTMRIVGGALAGAVGPEVLARTTSKAAGAYGDVLAKTGIGRDKGVFAHQAWFENAPERVLTKEDGTTVKSPVPLKVLKDVPPQMPVTQRTKNALWEMFARRDDPALRSHKVSAEVFPVFDAMTKTLDQVGQANAALRQMVESPQVDALFRYNDKGWILGADGSPLPTLAKDGTVRTTLEGMPIPGVKGNDLFRNRDLYLANGLISPEQYAGLTRLSDNLINKLQIRDVQDAMKIKPGQGFDPEGYIPSGHPSHFVEETPLSPKGKKIIGQQPSSSYDRKYEYAGDAWLEEQLIYPTIDEAVGRYIDESLKQIVAKHYSDELARLPISGFDQSQLVVPKSLEKALKEAKKEATEIKSRLKTLNARQARNDRDVRLTSRWVDSNTNRVQALILQARDQTIRASERAEALSDARVLAQIAIHDTVSAVGDYRKLTNAIVADAGPRKALEAIEAEAQRLNTRLEDLMEVSPDQVDEVVRVVSEAWDTTVRLQDSAADDIAETLRRLDALEGAGNAQTLGVDFDAARTRKAVDEAGSLFADKVQERVKKAIDLARKETEAAANVRANITTAKSEELNRIIEQRARTLTTALGRQSKTAQELERVKAALQANIGNRKELKAQIDHTRNLARKSNQGLRGTQTKIRLPGWETGVNVPAEWENTLNKLLPPEAKGTNLFWKIYDTMNNVLRFFGATADMSHVGTVGLLNMADDPALGSRAFMEGLRSAKNPGREWEQIRNIDARLKSKGLPGITEGKLRGLQIEPDEVLNLSLGTPFRALGKMEEWKPIKAFNALYRAPSDFIRASQYEKALLQMQKQGLDVHSDAAIRQAANAANLMGGRATRGPLGLSGDMSGRTFFAGRFFESQIETVLNAMLVSGVEGDVARRALLRIAGAGTAITYLANKAQGRDTEWNLVEGFKWDDPLGDGLNPNWMRVRVLGHDYSIFGTWDSLMKGIVSTAQGDPYMFMRSKMAPIAGMVTDITRGEDVFGKPLDRGDIKDYAPIPFALRDLGQEALDTDFTEPRDIADLALSGVAGTLGIKNAPLTAREVYKEKLDKAYANYVPQGVNGQPLNYEMGDPLNDPLFLVRYAAEHPEDVPPASSELGKALKKEKDFYGGEIAKIDTAFTNGDLTLGEWKAARNKQKDEQRGAMKNILAQMEFDEGSGAKKWVDEYYQTFEQAKEGGLISGTPAYYERVDELQAEWLERNGQVAQDYIDALTLVKKSGVDAEYGAAILKLKQDGYFDMPKFAVKLSTLDDRKILSLAEDVSRWTDAETGLEEFKVLAGQPFKTRAFLVLSEKGYPEDQIIDVMNSQTTKNQSLEYKLYKLENAATLAWLNPNQKYETLAP